MGGWLWWLSGVGGIDLVGLVVYSFTSVSDSIQQLDTTHMLRYCHTA